jgi:hypothetical protein
MLTARHFLRATALAISLLFTNIVFAADVRIIKAEFGLFEAGEPGEVMFSPTLTIPNKDGQRYGWVIELVSDQRSLLVREEYLYPEKIPVVNLQKDDTLVFPNPRRHQVSERRLVPEGGKIVGEWAIGPNEPFGERHLLVVIDGAPDTRFDYRVE